MTDCPHPTMWVFINYRREPVGSICRLCRRIFTKDELDEALKCIPPKGNA